VALSTSPITGCHQELVSRWFGLAANVDALMGLQVAAKRPRLGWVVLGWIELGYVQLDWFGLSWT